MQFIISNVQMLTSVLVKTSATLTLCAKTRQEVIRVTVMKATMVTDSSATVSISCWPLVFVQSLHDFTISNKLRNILVSCKLLIR